MSQITVWEAEHSRVLLLLHLPAANGSQLSTMMRYSSLGKVFSPNVAVRGTVEDGQRHFVRFPKATLVVRSSGHVFKEENLRKVTPQSQA